MSWLLYVCLDLIFTVLCYLTNWFVVIFADEKGQLPKVFKLWQTYDNPLDIRWQVLEVVPKFLRYDFDSHYIYHYEMKGDGYMRPGFVQLWYNDFTKKERVQRYFCRLLWLRNLITSNGLAMFPAFSPRGPSTTASNTARGSGSACTLAGR